MSLDDQLAELLATLGVELEGSTLEAHSDSSTGSQATTGSPTSSEGGSPSQRTYPTRYHFGQFERGENADQGTSVEEEIPLDAPSELSLFQTSREHYGVFYRLDLSQGVPHLRIFLPDAEGCLKMGCYLVRAAQSTPLHQWFVSTREHAGSDAYNEIRDTAHQHLLFAAGELMKRLFWTGSIEEMSFPSEIEVLRLI
jgi:hypothetical protein